MNPEFRCAADEWLLRSWLGADEVAPICDVNEFRDTMVGSILPPRIERLFGKGLWGCSPTVSNREFLFPCLPAPELLSAWALERAYQEAKKNGTIEPGVWSQPRFPYPETPTHPRQIVDIVKS